MRMLHCGFALVAISALAAAALAQTSPLGGGDEAPPPTPVRGVTITAHTPTVAELIVAARKTCFVRPPPGEAVTTPQVVDIYPAKDQQIPAGLLFIRVTFDQPMSRCGYSITSLRGRPYPDQIELRPHLTPDLKTFILPERVRADVHYRVEVNGAFDHFKNIFGRPAAAYPITFTTTQAVSKSVAEAIQRDPGLGAAVSQPDPLVELAPPTPVAPYAGPW
jgi:hypothetical protein